MFSFVTCSAGSVNSFPGRSSVCCTWSSSVVLVFCKCPGSPVKGLYLHRMSSVLCHAASVHFSLSVREMITGVLWGKMPQDFLFLALNPLGLLDLACIPHPSSLTPGADLLLWLPPAGRHLHDLLPAHGWGGRSLLSCSCPCRALTCPPRATPVSGPSKLGIGPFCSHLVLGFLFQSSAYQKNPHNFLCTGWGRKGREKLPGIQNFPSSYNPTLYFKYLCYIIGHFQHVVNGKNMHTVHFCFWVLHRPLPCRVSPSLSFSTF